MRLRIKNIEKLKLEDLNRMIKTSFLIKSNHKDVMRPLPIFLVTPSKKQSESISSGSPSKDAFLH
jgi:hypothetical protein